MTKKAKAAPSVWQVNQVEDVWNAGNHHHQCAAGLERRHQVRVPTSSMDPFYQPMSLPMRFSVEGYIKHCSDAKLHKTINASPCNTTTSLNLSSQSFGMSSVLPLNVPIMWKRPLPLNAEDLIFALARLPGSLLLEREMSFLANHHRCVQHGQCRRNLCCLLDTNHRHAGIPDTVALQTSPFSAQSPKT